MANETAYGKQVRTFQRKDFPESKKAKGMLRMRRRFRLAGGTLFLDAHNHSNAVAFMPHKQKRAAVLKAQRRALIRSIEEIDFFLVALRDFLWESAAMRENLEIHMTSRQTWQRPTLPRLKTKYHRRRGVSRPSSEWDRVQPPRHNHQVGGDVI